MTATDTLRAMLDGRGVEHWDTVGITEYRGENDRTVRCYARSEPMTLDVAIIAAPPEQAIEATLGRGTCEMLDMDNYEDADGAVWDDQWECSECEGKTFGVYVSVNQIAPPRYCPNCGRKVRA